MNNINKLENMMAKWYEKAPRLPKNGQKWLATNAWWIALVGVILGAMGLLTLISVTFFAGALLAGLGGYAGVALAGVAIVVVLVSIAISVVSLILTAMAITPLKAMQKKGWTLIFMTVLLSVASQVVSFLVSYDFFGLIWGLIVTAFGAYFLFEVRSYFGGKKEESAKSVEAPADKKEA